MVLRQGWKFLLARFPKKKVHNTRGVKNRVSGDNITGLHGGKNRGVFLLFYSGGRGAPFLMRRSFLENKSPRHIFLGGSNTFLLTRGGTLGGGSHVFFLAPCRCWDQKIPARARSFYKKALSWRGGQGPTPAFFYIGGGETHTAGEKKYSSGRDKTLVSLRGVVVAAP